MGWGIAFQVAPSNVPVQFAVSFTYAFLSGNLSIIRISNKEFAQVTIICDAIRKVLNEYCPYLIPYICIIRYDHNDEITEYLSNLCDIRMIWGGNNTIEAIRRHRVSPRCMDLGFADRYSITIINADDYMEMDAEVIAEAFYNDTYFSDQNACSSSRIIIWIGERVKEAKSIFWPILNKVVTDKYKLEPIMSSEKLLNTALLAAVHPAIRQRKIDNYMIRIELPELYDDIMDYKHGCGYFFEYEARKLNELIPLLKKECQTVTYVGEVETELREIIYRNGVKGVDRIVPVGHGSDLSLIWDGLDMPIILSRQVADK